MGLRLAVNGVMGVDTRSALRRFQGQQGLRVSGILGPDTQEALTGACKGDEAAAQAEAEFYVSEEAEIPAIPAEDWPKFKPLQDTTVEAINGVQRLRPGESSKPTVTILLGHLDDTAALRRARVWWPLPHCVYYPQNPTKVRAYSGKGIDI